MGSSSSVSKKNNNKPLQEQQAQPVEKTVKNQKKESAQALQEIGQQKQRRMSQKRESYKKKSINISYKDNRDGDSQENDEKESYVQQEAAQRDSFSDLDEAQYTQSRQDQYSRAGSKAQFNLTGKSNIQKQNSFRSPSFIQFQRENFHNHKAQQSQQQERRLFGDFYVGTTLSNADKNTSAFLTNTNHDEVASVLNKDDIQKKKELQETPKKEKKSPTVEVESKNIVEIKERNQNFFTKGNVVLSVNQYSHYQTQKLQNQDELQSQLLKQIVELGIKPTEYILNNSIKQEYEDKKNMIEDFEGQSGSKNQKNKNSQKVQIIIYPGFHEMFQNKNANNNAQKYVSS